MRPIALRAVALISIAVALACAARPKPPSTPETAGRSRGSAAIRKPRW